MFLSGQANFFSQLVLGQVDFCNISTALYLCSENKGTDQLHGYRTADLSLCFHICKKQVMIQLNKLNFHWFSDTQ